MWWTFFNDKRCKFCFKEINYKLMNIKNKNPFKKYYHWEIWLLENLKYCHWQFKNIAVRNLKNIVVQNK